MEAVAKIPGAAMLQYHLGVALALTGQKLKGREGLARALALKLRAGRKWGALATIVAASMIFIDFVEDGYERLSPRQSGLVNGSFAAAMNSLSSRSDISRYRLSISLK